jgi:Leucine-rich repeat
MCIGLQLQELVKLRPLNNISELVAADNPVSQLSHYRLFLIFHLRTLQILDGKTIDFQERQLADGRFSQGEYDVLPASLVFLSNWVFYKMDLLGR